jgi:hypothetical protein
MAGAGGMNNEEGAYGRGAYSDHLGGWRPRYRRRRPVPPASQTYQGDGLVFSAVAGLAGVVAGIAALVIGEIQGLILLGGGCVAVSIGTGHPIV